MFVLVECNIPDVVTGLLAEVYKAIIILIPIGIVLFGTIDFVKAIAAKDEAAISASGKTFVSRLITGCLTFFVLTIVTWIFKTIIGSVGGASSAMDCAFKILGGKSNYQSNAVTNKINKEICYSTQYSSCISNNPSPTAQKDCNNAANNICETNKTTTASIEYLRYECMDNCENNYGNTGNDYIKCINVCDKKYPKTTTTTTTTTTKSAKEKCLENYSKFNANNYAAEICNMENADSYRSCLQTCVLSGQTSDNQCMKECKKSFNNQYNDIWE